MVVMIDDFKPAVRRAKSLQSDLGNLSKEQTSPKSIGSDFQTPEEIAAASDEQAASPLLNAIHVAAAQNSQPKKTSHVRKFVLHWPPKKKELIVGLIIVLIIASGAGSWLLLHHSPKPVVAATIKPAAPKPAPKPTTVPSSLSGLPVDPSVNQRPVTATMIENSDEARPQAGLSQAGVVFEAVAEGGVTRFMALYQDTQPANVGPIRSARPYYIQWALGFDAAYAHVGGSPDALADIKSWKVKDLDQFYNGGSYHRVSSRQAPHNVYTAVTTLNQLETSKGYSASSFTSWPRKTDAASKQPVAKTINLALSGPDYNAQYSYNAASNSYNRSEGGAPQIDANTNTQISPKVVIAIVVPESRGALDATGAYYSDYNPIGSGAVDIFQDGTVTTGQWTKASNNSQLTFADAAGQPIKLNAGQTWITAVSSASGISSAP